jgi:hypothetical protein
MKIPKTIEPPKIILFVFFIFLIYWFRFFFTSLPLPSSDIFFHISTIEKLKLQWYRGTYSFYDPSAFTGWPALQFYGFLPFLITALISYLLDPFSSESVRLTVHSVIVLGTSALVFTLYYASKPFVDDLFNNFDSETLRAKKKFVYIFLSIAICTLGYWFINHDYQEYGIGITAPLNAGLYGQLFGWHALLLYVGSIGRLINKGSRRNLVILSLAIPLNFLCHTLTAVFAIFLGFLCFIWFGERRRLILKGHLLGFGLLGFWLIPFLAFSSEYTVYHPISRGDFLEILLRYPLYNFLETLKLLVKGEFVLINYTNILVWFLLITALLNHGIKGGGLLKAFLVFTLISLVLFSSEYIILSLPIGLHYYRFYGMIFLLLVVLLSAVSLSWLRFIYERRRFEKEFTAVYLTIFLICLCFNVAIPHFQIDAVENNEAIIERQFLNKESVLDFFKNEKPGARVFFEYLDDYKKFPPVLSHHYLSDNLNRRTGDESISGVQLLQSPSYRFIMESLSLLGARTYKTATLFDPSTIDLDKDTLIEQLKSFGITHIVAGTQEFISNILEYAIKKPVKIGPYYILQIQDTPFDKVNATEKQLVGYIDLEGNLPFGLMEYYFYFHKELTANFELIEIENTNHIPKQIKTFIVNSSPGSKKFIDLQKRLENDNVVELNYVNSAFKIDHYNPYFYPHMERKLYTSISDYLDGALMDKLLNDTNKSSGQTSSEHSLNPVFSWIKGNQSFRLSSLVPGTVYRINYSYFPYWHTKDGQIFRGSGDRIFFIPEKKEAVFVYTRIYSKSTWIGWLITICSIGYILRVYNQSRKEDKMVNG